MQIQLVFYGYGPADTFGNKVTLLHYNPQGNIKICDLNKDVIDAVKTRYCSRDGSTYVVINGGTIKILDNNDNVLKTYTAKTVSYSQEWYHIYNYILYIVTNENKFIKYDLNTRTETIIKELTFPYVNTSTISIRMTDDGYLILSYGNDNWYNQPLACSARCYLYDSNNNQLYTIIEKNYNTSTNRICYAAAICNLSDRIYISIPSGEYTINIYLFNKSSKAITTIKSNLNNSTLYGGVYLHRSIEGFEDNNYIYFPYNVGYDGAYARCTKDFSTITTSYNLIDCISDNNITNITLEYIYKLDNGYLVYGTYNDNGVDLQLMCKLIQGNDSNLTLDVAEIYLCGLTNIIRDNQTFDINFGCKYSVQFVQLENGVLTVYLNNKLYTFKPYSVTRNASEINAIIINTNTYIERKEHRLIGLIDSDTN